MVPYSAQYLICRISKVEEIRTILLLYFVDRSSIIIIWLTSHSIGRTCGLFGGGVMVSLVFRVCWYNLKRLHKFIEIGKFSKNFKCVKASKMISTLLLVYTTWH